MSSDLEQRLREGRATLPAPDADATERARERALAALRRRRPRARIVGAVGIALVVALALGTGLGALLAPRGTAARAAVGTGFLPEPGWTVLQTGADATAERQALAIATNVPLHPEDDARGIRGSSGLPYETLLRLPPRGVVIVALFTVREPYTWMDDDFPEREPPLHVREAMSSILYSTQVRPERPLGQYQLRVRVNGHYVDLHFYFGTRHPSPDLIAVAQRQLDKLVVGSVSASDSGRALLQRSAAPSASKVIDRTVVCETGVTGGIREIEVRAAPPIRSLKRGGSLAVSTYILPTWDLGGVGEGGLRLSPSCKPTGRIPLRSGGLTGGAIRFEELYDCATPRRVLIRVRGIFRSPKKLRRGTPYGTTPLLFAFAPVSEGQLAIRTQSGKALAYGSFVASRSTRLFVADSCTRDHRR